MEIILFLKEFIVEARPIIKVAMYHQIKKMNIMFLNITKRTRN